VQRNHQTSRRRDCHCARVLMKLGRRSANRSRVLLVAMLIIGLLVGATLWKRPAEVVVPRKGDAAKPTIDHRVDDGTDDPTIPMKPDPKEDFGDQRPAWGMTGRGGQLVRNGVARTHYITVVVMSYPKSSRFHLLEEIIRKVASWDFVWEVILVWNGDAAMLPQKIQDVTRAFPVKSAAVASGSEGINLQKQRLQNKRPFFALLPQAHNRVDNRWRIAQHVDTDAILNMDDDINLHQTGAQCMLNVWRASPSALVAIDVRSHFIHAKAEGGPFGPFGYVARDRSAGYKQYSIALPRALLTNRAYYVAYDDAWRASDHSDPTQKKGVKQIVDELLCDDIAFNFVAANTSLKRNEQLPGGHVIYVKAKYSAYPESHSADGMTKKEGMKAMRQKCVNALSKHLGDSASPNQGMLLLHRPWHVLCEVDG
jgi:hypothetical protein